MVGLLLKHQPMRFPLRLFLLLAGIFLVHGGAVGPVHAQLGGRGSPGGIVMELYGTVSLAPGRQVVTLAVGKGETLRFRVQDVESRHTDFSMINFLSEIRHRTPGLYIKGPAHYVDLLRKEEPEKRLLRLTGLYYSSARNFVLSQVRPVRPGEQNERNF